MITIFDFYNYSNNPIVQFCLSKYIDKQILSIDDCLQDILKLKHSQYCYDNDFRVRIGNELRLYYASISDDFIYVDADSWVENIEDLKMNHCYGEIIQGRLIYNDGSYFRANKNTDWVNYYVNIYENNEIGNKGTSIVYCKFPYKIPTQKLNHTHFYISCFNRFARNFPLTEKIYYTYDYRKALDFKRPIWLFDGNTGRITNTKIFHTTTKLPFEVFKDQLKFSFDNNCLFFEEI